MNSYRPLIALITILATVAFGPIGCTRMASTNGPSDAAYLPPPQSDQWERIDKLTQDLLALDPVVSESEARGLAQSAITHTAVLGQQYRVVRPPQLHNVLVKLGLKQRGLCYHWTEDLLRHLKKLNPARLQLQRVVAHRGSDLREHHSVIVITQEISFVDGIVLDGWRGSGKLYWVPAGEDHYPWVPLDSKVHSDNGFDAH